MTPDRAASRSPGSGVAPALAVFALATLVVLALRPLLPIDETRYLSVAWEMRRDGSWLVPHQNGAIYGHKPPLLFWLINLVWLATGTDGWAAETLPRLIGPAFLACGIWVTARLTREMWPDQPDRPGLAALILATTGLTMVYGTATMFDSMLVAATALGLLALWRMVRHPGLGPVVLLGVALALGAYGKGPVILVHLAPVALLAPLWVRDGAAGSYLRHLGRLGLALALALALVGVWLGPALVLGGPEYREEVLWRQSAGRMVESFAHQRPWWWFVALLPVVVWPWGWLPGRARALADGWRDDASRLLTVQAGTALLIFSAISGKQLHYLLPELPAVAILLSGAAAAPRRWPSGAPVAGPDARGSRAHGSGASGRVVSEPERWRAWRALSLGPTVAVLAWGVAVVAGLAPTGVDAEAAPAGRDLVVALVLTALGVWLIARLPAGSRAAWAIPGPLTAVVILVLAQTVLWRAHDTTPLARFLASREADGLAFTGGSYHGEFTWTGRLTQPLAVLRDEAAWRGWAAAHPDGLIVTFEGALPLDPLLERPYRGGTAAIYDVGRADPS